MVPYHPTDQHRSGTISLASALLTKISGIRVDMSAGWCSLGQNVLEEGREGRRRGSMCTEANLSLGCQLTGPRRQAGRVGHVCENLRSRERQDLPDMA